MSSVVEVVMHEEMLPAFDQWLASHNFHRYRMPDDAQTKDDDGSIPIVAYGIGIGR